MCQKVYGMGKVKKAEKRSEIKFKNITNIAEFSCYRPYTELFNFANSEPYNFYYYFEMNLEEIRSSARSHLDDTEYEKFIRGQNQKGIISFSLYCYYMKESNLLEDDDNGDNVLISAEYLLDKKYLKNHKPHKVFESISKNLTIDEYKELLTSKTILRSIFTGTEEIYIFDQRIMNEIEEKLTIQEQKQWLENVIEIISLNSDESLTEMFLNKFEDIFSDSEIVKIFQDHNILQKTAYSDIKDENFDYFWDFYVNHTTKEEQKLILKQNVEVECTDDFAFKTFANIRDSKDECFLFLSLNIFQYAFLSENHEKMMDIYENYFNSTEFQDMIVSSDDFLPFILKYYNSKSFNLLFFDLRTRVIQNESYFRKFLIKTRDILSEFKDMQDKIEYLSLEIEFYF